jgi:hypothetical protein
LSLAALYFHAIDMRSPAYQYVGVHPVARLCSQTLTLLPSNADRPSAPSRPA